MNNIKNFDSNLLRTGKKSYKTLVLIMLDTLQRKLLVIMKRLIV